MIPSSCEWRPFADSVSCNAPVGYQVEGMLLINVEEHSCIIRCSSAITHVMYTCKEHARISYKIGGLVADIGGEYWNV